MYPYNSSHGTFRMCSQHNNTVRLNAMLHCSSTAPVFRYLGAGATDSEGGVDPKVAAALLAAKSGRRRSGNSSTVQT